MLDVHLLAILLHALSGLIAFVVGVVIVTARPIDGSRLPWARAFLALMVSLEVFLLVAVYSHLAVLPTATRIVFAGLAVLGLFMIWQAARAMRGLEVQPVNQAAVLGEVGFDLISLFDAFAIVSALDLGAPPWVVAIAALGAVLLGILAITAQKRSLTAVRP